MHPSSFYAPLRCSKSSKNDAGTGGGETERIDSSSKSCTPNNQPCHPEWTASDRAHRISLNDELQRLLTKEVEKAGVVTTAGYKAVLQKFLYSDAVEEEMSHISNNAHGDRKPRSLRSGRLGSLVSSMSLPAAPPSLAASNMSASMSTQSQMMISRRQSNGSTISSIHSRRSSNESWGYGDVVPMRQSSYGDTMMPRRQSSSLGSSIINVTCRRFSNESTFDSAATNSYTCNNMAPRRASQCTVLNQDQQEALLQYSKKPNLRAELVSIKFGEVNFDSQDNISNRTSTRNTTNEGEEALLKWPSWDADNELKSSSQSHKDGDDGFFTWPGEQEDDNETNSIQSYTDEDGWLPWPEQRKNDSGDKDGSGGNVLTGIMNCLKKEI